MSDKSMNKRELGVNIKYLEGVISLQKDEIDRLKKENEELKKENLAILCSGNFTHHNQVCAENRALRSRIDRAVEYCNAVIGCEDDGTLENVIRILTKGAE